MTDKMKKTIRSKLIYLYSSSNVLGGEFFSLRNIQKTSVQKVWTPRRQPEILLSDVSSELLKWG